MPIVTGSDTARTRRDLTVGGKTVSYYSIQAATVAGLGAFAMVGAWFVDRFGDLPGGDRRCA